MSNTINHHDKRNIIDRIRNVMEEELELMEKLNEENLETFWCENRNKFNKFGKLPPKMNSLISIFPRSPNSLISQKSENAWIH